MKNTVKKVLCTFIAVVAAVTSTLVFTGCGSKKATSDVSIPDYTFSESSKKEESSQAEESSRMMNLLRRKVQRKKKVKKMKKVLKKRITIPTPLILILRK